MACWAEVMREHEGDSFSREVVEVRGLMEMFSGSMRGARRRAYSRLSVCSVRLL